MSARLAEYTLRDILTNNILSSLHQLPQTDRDIFVMSHYQNQTEDEISRTLKLTNREIYESLSRSSSFLMSKLKSIRKTYPDF